MNKKISIVLSVCLVCALLLSGCSIIEPDPSSFPSMKGVDTAGMSLAEVRNEQIKVAYSPETWKVQEDSALLSFVLTESENDEFKTNINVQVSSEYDGPFKTRDRNTLYQSLSSYGYLSFDAFELRRLNNEVIIYAEMITEFTDKRIDKMVKEGLLTEESLDSIGGREYLLTIPTTYQTMIYTICDGHICVFTGTFYDEKQKDLVLEQMLVMIDSVDVLVKAEG